MASGKTKRKKTSTKITVIKAIVATVLVLCVVGYMVYITGIVPKCASAITIYEKNEAGVDTKVCDISVLETNLHVQEILNMYYYMYGINKSVLDQPMDESSSKTYREFMTEQAAEELMNTVIINRAAKAAGYDKISGAERYANLDVENIREMVDKYNYQTADHYLQAVYGTGMTVNTYKDFLMNDALFQEYQQYVSQFMFTVSEEDLKAKFDENPATYQKLDFNYYFFAAELDDEEKATNMDVVTKQAQKVADRAKDSKSFRTEVYNILKANSNEKALETFKDDANPTEHLNYDPANVSYLPEGFEDFLFKSELGKTTVITTEKGAYAVLIVDRKTDDEATVSYRTLTLNNDVFNKEGATLEEIAAGAQATKAEAEKLVNGVTTAEAFVNVVKQNSDEATEIISGGYNEAVKASTFDKDTEAEITDLDAKRGEWLLSEDRKCGDIYYEVAADNSKVTIYFFEDNLPAWMSDARTDAKKELASEWTEKTLGEGTSYKAHHKTFKYLIY